MRDPQKYLALAPSLSRAIMERAYAGTASPRQAIKAKCLECTGFHREDVAACSSSSCPLWAYRHYQHFEAAENA